MKVLKSSKQEIRSVPRLEATDEADDKAVFQIQVFPREKDLSTRREPASVHTVEPNLYLRRARARLREMSRNFFRNWNHEIGPSPHQTLDSAGQARAHHSAAITLLLVDQRRVHLEDKRQKRTLGST